MVPPEPCPRCRRPNAVHRVSCLYCGAALPNPRPELAPAKKEVSAKLDELVREALRGGSLGKLEAALVEEVRAPAGEAAPVVPSVAAPRPAEAGAVPPRREPEGPDEATALLAQLAGRVEALRRQAARGPLDPADLARARAALDLLSGLAALGVPPVAEAAPERRWSPAAEPGAEAPPEARAVILPPFRHPWALVLAGGPADRAERLAAALEVDGATARALAASPFSRVALRSADRAGLERRAAAWGDARVLSRAELLEIPAARSLVRVGPGHAGAAVDLGLWEDPPAPDEVPPGPEVDLAEVFLVVVGEVVEREGIAAREATRWERSRVGQSPGLRESRRAVVDLHVPGAILRAVEGLSAVVGEAGGGGRSAAAFRAWLGGLASTFPAAILEPRRVCAADAPGGSGARKASGWPIWEEHSRAARALHAHLRGAGGRGG